MGTWFYLCQNYCDVLCLHGIILSLRNDWDENWLVEIL